jgi:uncharacterized protein HemX
MQILAPLVEWLKNQSKETVILVMILGMVIYTVGWIQPEHFKIINNGYLEVQKRHEQFQEIRDQKFLDHMSSMERELSRLNQSLENRDKQNERVMEFLINKHGMK